MKRASSNSGFTLLEVIMALALLMTVTIGTVAGNTLATKGTTASQNRAEANRLANEAMEAVHSLRAASFTSLQEGTYHPFVDTNGWNLAAGSEQTGTDNGFVRQILISKVYRSLACTEGICDIVDAGGIVDEGSFKAKVQVDWEESGENQQIMLETLITYWR